MRHPLHLLALLLPLALSQACQIDPEDTGDAGPATDAAPLDAAPDAAPDSAVCPPPIPLESCFRGLSFAECPGDGDPALWCGDLSGDSSTEECLWFPNGCPAQETPRHCPDGVSAFECMVQGHWAGWGRQPWDRERAMNLELQVEVGEAYEPLHANCGPCGVVEGAEIPEGWEAGRCGHRAELSVCRDPEEMREGLCRWLPSTTRPGLVAVSLGPCASLGAFGLVFELDLEQAQARACIIEVSDAAANPEVEPLCAISGRVQVNRVVEKGEDMEDLSGRFELVFPTYSPWLEYAPFVTGLTVEGTF